MQRKAIIQIIILIILASILAACTLKVYWKLVHCDI